jgi:type IV pilus assembly protein PilB
MQAALTGHLVLSTLHTNDAASAINRLLDLGVNTSILASTLSIVLAQRLIRKLCPLCAERYAPDDDEKAVFERNGLALPSEIARAAGCESCLHSGYRGRDGIYEVIPVDRTIEKLIFSGAPHSEIKDAAIAAGTVMMFTQALRKVSRGLTSLEEVRRVIVDNA